MIAFENLKGFGAVLNLQSFLYDMIWEHSGSVVECLTRDRGNGLEPHQCLCVVSLRKTHLSLLSIGSTQEDPSQHN